MVDAVNKRATETRLRRTAARNWRTSSARRAGKLGRILPELPSIDDVEAALVAEATLFPLKNGLSCGYCSAAVDFTKSRRLNLDHATPISRGGDASIANLIVSCGPCNRAKGEATFEEFQQLRALVRTWEDGGRMLFIRLRMGFFGR